MKAHLADGTQVVIVDRTYHARPDGETVLVSVTTVTSRVIAASRVASITY